MKEPKKLTWTDKTEDEVFEENTGLILHTINKYFINDGKDSANLGTNEEDLYQWGSIGLSKAIRNYNEDKKVPFGPYAVMMIRYTIMQETNPNHSAANKRQALNDHALSISGISSEFTDKKIDDEYDSLARQLGPNRLSEISYTDDTLEKLQVCEFKKSLKPYEMYVLQGLLDGKSQADIAKELGVSRQSINARVNTIRNKYYEYVN